MLKKPNDKAKILAFVPIVSIVSKSLDSAGHRVVGIERIARHDPMTNPWIESTKPTTRPSFWIVPVDNESTTLLFRVDEDDLE